MALWRPKIYPNKTNITFWWSTNKGSKIYAIHWTLKKNKSIWHNHSSGYTPKPSDQVRSALDGEATKRCMITQKQLQMRFEKPLIQGRVANEANWGGRLRLHSLRHGCHFGTFTLTLSLIKSTAGTVLYLWDNHNPDNRLYRKKQLFRKRKKDMLRYKKTVWKCSLV